MSFNTRFIARYRLFRVSMARYYWTGIAAIYSPSRDSHMLAIVSYRSDTALDEPMIDKNSQRPMPGWQDTR